MAETPDAAGHGVDATPVLILAGGRAERLGDVADVPKPLLDVGGRPFIGYLLEALWRHGLRRICCLTGHRAEAFPNRLRSAAAARQMPFLSELHLDFQAETAPLGTGGALGAARHRVDERALVLNGDSYCEVDYQDVLRTHPAGAGISLTAVHLPEAGDCGALQIDERDRLRGFREKGASGAGWVNAGVYCVHRRFLDAIPPGKVSLEREVLPAWLAREEIRVLRTRGFFRDIGTPDRLARARAEFPDVVRAGRDDACGDAPGRS
ncbi:MAG: NTP transferase domain-containing protein [Candidatus Eisenbacteria bacterium]|nr:NTP transferase domain-containing protein [Candidatus Eisenbacteria bacterium]